MNEKVNTMSYSYIEKKILAQAFRIQDFEKTLAEYTESVMLVVNRNEDKIQLF